MRIMVLRKGNFKNFNLKFEFEMGIKDIASI
jgi:hypothetical protein